MRLKNLFMAGLLSGLALSATSVMAEAETKAQPVVMGYYANWDVYSQQIPDAAQNFLFTSQVTQQKLARMNSVAYAFFETASDGTVQSVDSWSDFTTSDASFCNANPKICFTGGSGDVTGGMGNFTAFANSGDTNGITNRLLAVGGAGHDAAIESAMNNPQNFINSLKTLKASYPITGLDLDYEPTGGIPVEYQQKFIDLIKDIRSAMGPDFMITYTIIANSDGINALGANNWKQIVDNVDYINIMGYDMFGAWETMTGLQSALYVVPGSGGSDRYSDDLAVNALVQNGVPENKMVLGFPAYARAVSYAAANGLGQTFAGAYEGEYASSPGMMVYSEIASNGMPMTDVVEQGTVVGTYTNFVTNDSGNVFASFDSPNSIMAKTKYAQSKNFAGVMFWDLNYDAPATDSAGNNNTASLLNAVNGVYGIEPREVPPATYFILQVSNTGPDVAGPDAYSSATLVVNGGYYIFGNEWNSPISPGLSQSWGTEASAAESDNVFDNATLDGFFANGATSFTTSQILINGYPSYDSDINYPNGQYNCNLGENYTFEAGHSYNVMVNAAYQSCDIQKVN